MTFCDYRTLIADYKEELNSNPSFGATTSYTITITCADNYGSSSNDLTVSIDANTDPVMTGLPVTVTVSEVETAARCLHTVAVTDTENHAITCSVASSPAGPFEMQQNALISGQFIKLCYDLCVAGYK